MSKITARATKAEILEAYAALEAQASQGPSWAQVWSKLVSTAQTVYDEFTALVADTYKAGALTRQWVSAVATELSQPVLKSKS